MWSWGDNFAITDEDGNECFFVKSTSLTFPIGKNLSFLDVDGKEIAVISQDFFNFLPKYAILIGGHPYAHLVREFNWFKRSFRLDVLGPNEYTIEGSFWKHEYVFKKKEKVVAIVSKKVWSLTDSYGIDILGQGYDVEILSACIIIDQILFSGN